MQVIILGSAAGGPFQGRNYTSQLLKSANEVYLIDCGEGTQHQLFRSKTRYFGINQIFISHLHGDHVFGLMGLLTSFCLKGRTDRMEIFGPEGLKELIETTARITGVRFPYEVVVHEVDTTVSAQVFESKSVEVWTIPLNHRTLCTGWLFKQKSRLPKMRIDKIEEYQIPHLQIKAIKEGADLHLSDGTVVPHSELTTLPPNPVSYAFCSDTAPSAEVVAAIKDVTVLYHEATFTEEHAEEAAFSGHSTASQAARVALEAGAGKLLLGHFSSRYKELDQHLMEARAVFPASYLVEEGESYAIE